MKTIKKLTIAFAISGFLFTSCTKTKKEKMEDKMEEVEDKMEDVGDDISNEFQEMKLKLENGTEVNYNMTDDGDLSFDDWDGFNILNKELRDIKALDYETTTARVENLNGTVMNLRNTIPAWLKNDEVMEDIENVEKEYNNVMTDTDKTEDNVKQNLEDLSEKFDDLREELNEIIEKLKK